MEWWQWAGSYWWLVFPLAGIIGGWAKAAAKFDERRRRDRIELERVRQQGAAIERDRHSAEQERVEARRLEASRLVERHERLQREWLDYELDVGKLIEFPLMTDMREDRTVRFHRAKRIADALRPASPELLDDPSVLAEYRTAVVDFESAFREAEAEAKRRRTSDFTDDERRQLDRARSLMRLAADDAATAAERQTAYRQARKALDGLIVLPDRTVQHIEHDIAGALERGSHSSRA